MSGYRKAASGSSTPPSGGRRGVGRACRGLLGIGRRRRGVGVPCQGIARSRAASRMSLGPYPAPSGGGGGEGGRGSYFPLPSPVVGRRASVGTSTTGRERQRGRVDGWIPTKNQRLTTGRRLLGGIIEVGRRQRGRVGAATAATLSPGPRGVEAGRRGRRRRRRRVVSGVDGDSEVAKGVDGDSEGGGVGSDAGYMVGRRCHPARLLSALTRNRPAANLFCTRDRCTHSSRPFLVGGYMREGSERRPKSRIDGDSFRPLIALGKGLSERVTATANASPPPVVPIQFELPVWLTTHGL